MRRTWFVLTPVLLWILTFAVTTGAGGVPQGGWKIPATAATEKSPLTVSDATVAAGRKLFVSKCQRCHGTAGKGDGADGDPNHQDDMDLTAAAGAARNPDGVVYYKIWNGRSGPKMPAFSEQLTPEQAWTIVAYVQTLRPKK
jgi:mono/diheme cytochrome c family protein